MGHCKNSQNEHEYEVFDILYNVDQHADIVTRIPKDPKEVEEPDPHYNGCKGIKSADNFRFTFILSVVFKRYLLNVKASIVNLCDHNQHNQALVHVVPNICNVRFETRDDALSNLIDGKVSDKNPYDDS